MEEERFLYLNKLDKTHEDATLANEVHSDRLKLNTIGLFNLASIIKVTWSWLMIKKNTMNWEVKN